MENNNPEAPKEITKKNKSTIIVAVLIVILLVIIVAMKTIGPAKNPPVEQQESQTDKDLNNAVSSDSTKSIIDNLDKINTDDTSSSDLEEVDLEIQKL